MRRTSSVAQHRSDGVNLDSAMTPMIDVVFLLLVYFVWTTGIQVVEQIMPAELSSQIGSEPMETFEPPPEADFDNLVIRIGWDGTGPTWKLNDQAVISIDQLQQQLTSIFDVKSDAPVILHPDSEVPLGFVIKAFDVSRLAGFEKVSFAVQLKP